MLNVVEMNASERSKFNRLLSKFHCCLAQLLLDLAECCFCCWCLTLLLLLLLVFVAVEGTGLRIFWRKRTLQ
jgi:hypothetical protein